MAGRATWLLCSAVLLCCVSPAFLERAIRLLVHVSPLLRSFGVFFTVFMMLTVLVSSHVNLALQCCCFLVFFIVTVIGSSTCHLCSIAIAGPTLPLGRGVLEHRCSECSPLAATCQGLRLNMSLLEKKMSVCCESLDARGEPQHVRSIQGHSGVPRIDQQCFTVFEIPYGCGQYTSTILDLSYS